jgi:hypothetical protein
MEMIALTLLGVRLLIKSQYFVAEIPLPSLSDPFFVKSFVSRKWLGGHHHSSMCHILIKLFLF